MLELREQGKILFESKEIPSGISRGEFLLANFYEPIIIGDNVTLSDVITLFYDISELISNIFLEHPKALMNLVCACSTQYHKAIKIYPYMSIDHEGRLGMYTKFLMIQSEHRSDDLIPLEKIPVITDETVEVESFFDLNINQKLFRSITLASLADVLFFELFEFLKNNSTDFDQTPLTQ